MIKKSMNLSIKFFIKKKQKKNKKSMNLSIKFKGIEKNRNF